MRVSLVIAAMALTLTVTACAVSPSTPDALPAPDGLRLAHGTVVRVVDGDTAHVLVGGVNEKVRFIGIDTPEDTSTHEPYGAQATAYTRAAIDGREVWLETDAELRDRYGRLLAYVWLEPPASTETSEVLGKMLNAKLVAEGYAQIYTFPPNVKYAEVFLAAQRDARERGAGLWRVPGAADPLTGRRAEESP